MTLYDNLFIELKSQGENSPPIPESFSVSNGDKIFSIEYDSESTESEFLNMVHSLNGNEKKKGTILVIDDEESMHDSCIQILTRKGYEIITAFDGEHGMSLVREDRPDLVLLDFKLPGKSGTEILQEIVSTDPTIVIVVMTGYATIESAVEAMKSGASDFLPKPFTPNELRLIVNRSMEKRNLLVETRRLQAENERIRENFVSVITHEMRSPLVGVEQYIEVLLGGFAGELISKQSEILSKCKRRIKWLLSLVNEWLDMARIQDTIIIERLEDVRLKDVVDEAIDFIRFQAEKRKISMDFTIPDDLPVIRGNHEALVHLFMNLFSNAIKYNREHGKVSINACDAEDSILVQVSDTGIGIPKEMLPFIFDEFFRVSTIRKKNAKTIGETGTGLGLAIAKKLVDAHKGYINVESEEDVGTCVTVHLPKTQPPNGQQKSSAKEECE